MLLWFMILGCKKVEPAPKDLDDLFHFAFQEWEEGADELLHEVAVNFDDAVDGGKNFEYFDGTVSHLTDEEVAHLEVDQDPSKAPGIFLVNDYVCPWERNRRLLVYPDQQDFHSSYKSYKRTYNEDWEAFADGDIDYVSWELDYEASSFIVDYEAHTIGALRRVRPIDDTLSPFGEIIFGLTYLPKPAKFKNENKNMLQDYHLEVFWENAGIIHHAYALWRQADWGTGFTTEDEGIQRVALNALEDWDKDNEKACENGGF